MSSVEQSRFTLRSNLKECNLDRGSLRFRLVNCRGERFAVWRNTQSAQVILASS
jgi:hypothetical protein